MGKNLAEFRLAGIDVKVHWSFVLVLAFGAFLYGSGPAGWLVGSLYGMLTFLLLFVCVTLHEYGHALTARRYGIQTKSILLLPIGGVANLERMPEKPSQELAITVAGPLVNFAIALLLVPIVFLFGAEAAAGLGQTRVLADNMRDPGPLNLLLYLFLTNILLGVFNLLPAFPMDGGRILRALLAMTMPYVRATNIAVLVGRLMAVGLALYGIFTGSISLLLVAFFVYVGGSAELEAVSSRAVLRGVQARRALAPGAINLYTSERLGRALELVMSTYQTDYPVLDLGNRFVGVLTRPHLISALRQHGQDARVADNMLPATEVPDVTPDTDLSTVWETMSQRGSRMVAVKDNGQFLGLITSDDLTEVFQVMSAMLDRDQRRPPGAPEEPNPLLSATPGTPSGDLTAPPGSPAPGSLAPGSPASSRLAAPASEPAAAGITAVARTERE